MTTDGEVDKDQLYGRYTKREDELAEFRRRAAYKAVDEPLPEDMNIHSTKNGIGAGGATAIGLAAALPGTLAAAVMGYSMLNRPESPALKSLPAVPSIVEQAGPVDSEYSVRLVDEQGNRLPVRDIGELPARREQ